MKKKHHTTEQIIRILREAEGSQMKAEEGDPEMAPGERDQDDLYRSGLPVAERLRGELQ